MNYKKKIKGRFCCWCGKVEYTKTCQSKSIKKAAKKGARLVAEHILSWRNNHEL